MLDRLIEQKYALKGFAKSPLWRRCFCRPVNCSGICIWYNTFLAYSEPYRATFSTCHLCSGEELITKSLSAAIKYFTLIGEMKQSWNSRASKPVERFLLFSRTVGIFYRLAYLFNINYLFQTWALKALEQHHRLASGGSSAGKIFFIYSCARGFGQEGRESTGM